MALPIRRLAHKRVLAKTVTQTRRGNTSCDIPPPSVRHMALPFLPSDVTPPAPFLLSPGSYLPLPLVIPAQAGILTRGVLNQGHTVVNNHAGTPSRHQLNTECKDLCALKSLVWIRAMCKPSRPCPD